MNDLQNTLAAQHSFKNFLVKDRHNRFILYLVAAAIIIQFGIFKYLYPYASYIHGDSFSYLDAADRNLTINTYMVGYSKFIRLFSVFNKTDYILTAFQYLFIQCSALFLLFTIFYFYKTGRVVQYILISFMVCNPLFLHLANLVSSDGMFTGLSLTWFSLLLWVIHQPSKQIIIWQVVVLFIAFTFRYNALIYPAISALAFWLSKLPLRQKIAGLGLGIFVCGLFVGFTMYKYKQLTGYWQYSPFSGWQLANNAMYAYRSVDSADRKPVAPQYKALDNMIRRFFDTTRDVKKFPSEQAMASTFYMWSASMPLMKYRDSLFKSKNPKAGELNKWASMGPFYKSFGLYMIRKYPLHFIAYFLWPNARKYYAPPIEFLEKYNSGRDGVTYQAKLWFGYKSQKLTTRMKNSKTWVLNFYPILTGIINVIMLFGLLYYVLLKGWRYNKIFNKILIMGVGVWVLNAVFTIGASSAALRFQSFPIILTSIFALLLVDWLAQLLRSMKMEQVKKLKMQQQFSNEAIA
jgi:hypothetical protein